MSGGCRPRPPQVSVLLVFLHQPLGPFATVEQIPAAEVGGHALPPVSMTTATMGCSLLTC